MNGREVYNKIIDNLPKEIKEIINIFEKVYKKNRHLENQFTIDYPNVKKGVYDGQYYEYDVDFNGVNIKLSSSKNSYVFSVSEESDGLKYRSVVNDSGVNYKVFEKDASGDFVSKYGYMAFANKKTSDTATGKEIKANLENKPEINALLELIFNQGMTENNAELHDMLNMMCDVEITMPTKDLNKIISHHIMIKNIIEGKDNTPVNRKTLTI